MTGIVSGWSDDKHVWLVVADSDEPVTGATRRLKVPAKFAAFVSHFDPEDLKALARDPRVSAVIPDSAPSTFRIEFKNYWERRKICDAIAQRCKDTSLMMTLRDSDEPRPKIYEADVGPIRRLFSDNGKLEIGTPRVGYFDLETDSRVSFADAVAGKARILAWSLYGLGFSDRVVLAEDTNDAEAALLDAFYAVADRFDCLVAWNGDGFDFPVIRARTQQRRIKHPGGTKEPLIPERWCWLDQLQVYKKYNQAHDSGEERTSFRLNAVAMHLLGEGKDDFDASKTWEAWHAGGAERERMLRYCDKDTALLPRIEEKTGFVAMHLAVCQVTRCLPDSASLAATQQGDGFLLRLGTEHGYRFPNKPHWDDSGPEPFKGAFVMEPKAVGLIDDVHVCDFAGLYPSIMRTWNMSAETLTTKRHDGPKCKLPDRDVYFRTDTRGIYALALDTLVAKRAEYTKRADSAEPGSDEWNRFKRLSSAYKIIANSFYGIVGSPYARFFSPTIAEGVTQTGAWLIRYVMDVAERAGMTPIYGDTDSAFAQGSAETFERIVDELNAGWPGLTANLGCTENRVKLEFEKSFKRLILVSKKRYAARFARYKGKDAPADMKPEVKGLEYKRGDTLRLAREMQKELIDELLKPTPPTLDEAKEFVAKWRERVLRGDLELADVTLSQSVKAIDEYKDRFTNRKCSGPGKIKCSYDFGDTEVELVKGVPQIPSCPKCGTPRKLYPHPAHVRVAKMLLARGDDITAGTRIEYVIAKATGAVDETLCAIPASEPGALESVDRDAYWDKRVLPATARVLEVVYPGTEWAESVAKRAKAERATAPVEELPLFAARSESPPPPPPPPKRRRSSPTPRVASPQGTPPPAAVVAMDSVSATKSDMLRVREILCATPGQVPVRIEIAGAIIETGLATDWSAVEADIRTVASVLQTRRIA